MAMVPGSGWWRLAAGVVGAVGTTNEGVGPSAADHRRPAAAGVPVRVLCCVVALAPCHPQNIHLHIGVGAAGAFIRARAPTLALGNSTRTLLSGHTFVVPSSSTAPFRSRVSDGVQSPLASLRYLTITWISLSLSCPSRCALFCSLALIILYKTSIINHDVYQHIAFVGVRLYFTMKGTAFCVN